ncbi:unnamed protein product [Arctia plantaginis]|uniref:Gustatory receptor n=1 Tax=Arctia plantaginis TaxID=874455 RepID=A0A8S1AMM6_ARCPL|nr:unnamed protein product [Arctia plantaginis]
MLLDVICVIPKYLGIIYKFIGSPDYNATELAVTLLESIMPFIPGIFCEMVKREVDKIRLCVIKQLLVFRGAKARDAIKDTVTYFKHHPFRYTILRVLSIDLTLIFTTADLLTTYTLALIQFTHVFG